MHTDQTAPAAKKRRPRFMQAVRAELGAWRLSPEQKGLLIAFSCCLRLRLEGRDPAELWTPPATTTAPETIPGFV